MPRCLLIPVFCCGLAVQVAAQDEREPPETIPFDGGSFTITQNEGYEKVLAFDGREIARNFVVYFDKTVKLGDTEVALFSVGDGGNQCGTSTVIAWKDGAEMRSTVVGEDCGAPPAAVTDSSIYFVPFPLPGETLPVETWSPDQGIRTAGSLTFAPQPGTSWQTFDAAKLGRMIEAFDNKDVYEAASKLLGSHLTGVVSGLLTSAGAEKWPDGTVSGYGCVPHSCGSSDTFMAVDPKNRQVYLAQQDTPAPRTWPELSQWPAALKSAMEDALLNEQ